MRSVITDKSVTLELTTEEVRALHCLVVHFDDQSHIEDMISDMHNVSEREMADLLHHFRRVDSLRREILTTHPQ